jgi:hypothetical protein
MESALRPYCVHCTIRIKSSSNKKVDQIPFKILIHCCSFLPYTQLIHNVSLVNTLLYQLVQENQSVTPLFWSTICEKQRISIPFTNVLTATMAKKLKSMKIKKWELIYDQIFDTKYFEMIHDSVTDLDITTDSDEEFTTPPPWCKFPNLTRVNCWALTNYFVRLVYTQLKHLELNTFQEFQFDLTRMPNHLETLVAEILDGDQKQYLPAIINANKNTLTRIKLAATDTKNELNLCYDKILKCSNLSELDLIGDVTYHPQIAIPPTNLQNLTQLKLNLDKKSSQILHQIFSINLHYLTYLKLHIPQELSLDISQMKPLNQLQSLDITGGYQLMELVNPKLQHLRLYVYQNAKLSFQRFTHLESFNIIIPDRVKDQLADLLHSNRDTLTRLHSYLNIDYSTLTKLNRVDSVPLNEVHNIVINPNVRIIGTKVAPIKDQQKFKPIHANNLTIKITSFEGDLDLLLTAAICCHFVQTVWITEHIYGSFRNINKAQMQSMRHWYNLLSDRVLRILNQSSNNLIITGNDRQKITGDYKKLFYSYQSFCKYISEYPALSEVTRVFRKEYKFQ